jgi:UDP-N-acetyl-D-galactosamine dehydrogenase
VIGLDYVGLPVAVTFARSGIPVLGFDIDRHRIEELRFGHDQTREVDAAELAQRVLTYTSVRPSPMVYPSLWSRSFAREVTSLD